MAMIPSIKDLNHEQERPALQLAAWTGTMKRSLLREMLAVTSRPGILSFAGGLPAPELFPAKEYAQAMGHVLESDARALQYGPPFAPLKEHIVQLMAQRGVSCTQDQVFLTTGAQQALNIVTRLLLNPGGQVIHEQLVYSGIQQAIAPYRPEILAVPTDMTQGMEVADVEAYLATGAQPAFVYAISEAHNPLGVSLSDSRGKWLVELAIRYGVPIVEDDPYGLLRYDGEPSRPLRALDDNWVFYVGSFSKLLAPALRLGWMVVPESLIPQLTVIKEGLDLESSALIQRSVAAYLDAGHLCSHLDRLRGEYGFRRDVMLEALERHFPAGARWTKPSAGMFIWVELPAWVDTTELLWTAVDRAGVAFVPGIAFCAAGSPLDGRPVSTAANSMRLNFTNSAPEEIEEGIGRLGELLKRYS
jgi:2-aminoadipate transaminase